MRTERKVMYGLAIADALFIAGVIFADDNLRWGSFVGAVVTSLILATQFKRGPVMTELNTFGFPENETEADRS